MVLKSGGYQVMFLPPNLTALIECVKQDVIRKTEIFKRNICCKFSMYLHSYKFMSSP